MQRNLRIFLRPALQVCMTVLITTTCFAQFNSAVEGTVTDPTGAAVGNAAVILHNVQAGIDLHDTTRSAGFFRFSDVGPGDYTVTVEASGFARNSTTVHVIQDQNVSTNVSLTVGATTAQVNVTAAYGQLNPDETRVQTTLEAQQIENLPLQNGSVLETVRLAPGVTGIDEDRSLSPVSINGNTMYAQANGRPNAGNTYQLDGVSIQDNTGYASGINHNLTFSPAEDMVQEVALETNSFALDYGSSSSMRVNITSKGGTNRFHGSFGDRYSGRGLNATADFASPAAPNSRRWYTASLGGPIWKDRTFFFFSYLHQNQTSSSNSLIHYATNDFTGTWAPANYPTSVNVKNLLVPFPIGAGSNGQVATTTKTAVAAYASDLFSTTTPGVCGVPIKNAPFYVGKQIGITPIDCGMEIVDTGTFNQSPRVNGYQVDARVDQYFRDGKDRFYAAYVLAPQVSDFIWWRPDFNSTTPGGARYLNVSYAHIFSPNLISQASASYIRFWNSFTSNKANVIPFLTLMLGSGDDATDYFGTPADPAWQKAHNYQVHEDVTWTHGRHTIKGGFAFARLEQYDQSAGASAKAQVPIYFSWSDLLDDQPWTYGLNTLSGKTGKFLPNIQGTAVSQFSLYAEDDWKIKPNLLITFGLRWDDYGNPAVYGDGSLPYYNMNSSANTATLRGNIVNGSIGTTPVSNAFAGAQDANLLPRIGVAWSPVESRKLTIHGGYGLFQDATNVGGVTGGLAVNSPSYLNLTFCYTCIAPLNDADPRNYYGTNYQAPAPFGMTYQFPAITPAGVDEHGQVILIENGVPTVLTSALSGVDRHLKPQTTSLYNVQIEQQVRGNFVFGIGYTGSYSWNQYASGDYNTYPGDQIVNNGAERRLSTEWAGVTVNKNLVSGNYNSLLLTARQNINRLSWQASFTWGKSLVYGGLIGGTSGTSVISDIYDPNHYYGPAAGSVPKSFNGSVAYELPGRNLSNLIAREALGGWTISGVTTAQAGTPFSLETTAAFVPIASALPSQGGTCTPTSPATTCGTDITNPSAAGTYLANGLENTLVNIPNGIKKTGFSRAQWKQGVFSSLGYTKSSVPTYTIAAEGPGFTNPAGYGVNPAYSNQGYNSFEGPGYLAVDAALHKKFLLPWFQSEQSTLTLGIEGTNVINRANLTGPASADLNTVSTFGLGVSQGANQARIYQLVGKFQF
jgi:Carboxypeptidase regulatory-like domain